MSWTNVSKPSAGSYTKIAKPSAGSYTNIAKPTGSIVATLSAGRTVGLIIPLTYSTSQIITVDKWVKISKPT